MVREWTGMHDKMGAKIYVGDLIVVDDYCDEESLFYEEFSPDIFEVGRFQKDNNVCYTLNSILSKEKLHNIWQGKKARRL